MKKLIAVPYGTLVPYDLSGDDVIRVRTKDTDDTFTVIAKCGIAIEDHLLKDGMNTLYSDPTKYAMAGIIWKNATDAFVDTEVPWVKTMRGDELLFPTLHHEYDSSWVVGHPRALIKWASCCVELYRPEIMPAYRYKDRSDQVWLAWLAHRIGLKVYGQQAL
jgi:hypothetical protein